MLARQSNQWARGTLANRELKIPHQRRRRRIRFSLVLSLGLLALPSSSQAQFNYVTNNGTITIRGYIGPPGPGGSEAGACAQNHQQLRLLCVRRPAEYHHSERRW